MTLAVLSIGSNVGDSMAHLRSVRDSLGDRLVAASSIYRTAPWGGIEQQPFLNAVLIGRDDNLDAWDWLAFAQECEQAAERTREVRWGPRTLDVDVVAVHDSAGRPVIQDDAELTLPHPRAAQRAFVLAPWVEVCPSAMLPHGPASDMLAALTASGAPDQQIELVVGEVL